MHDLDSKAVISNSEGKLIYADLNKFQAIQELNVFFEISRLQIKQMS